MKNILVAKVNSKCEVVINAGSNDDIEIGMKVLIYELGDEIIDPDSKVSLGKLEIVKGTGVVSHVQPKMSVVISNMKVTSKRVIRRKNPDSIRMHGVLNSLYKVPDEIVEEIPDEQKPFESPGIGDKVKITERY